MRGSRHVCLAETIPGSWFMDPEGGADECGCRCYGPRVRGAEKGEAEGVIWDCGSGIIIDWCGRGGGVVALAGVRVW